MTTDGTRATPRQTLARAVTLAALAAVFATVAAVPAVAATKPEPKSKVRTAEETTTVQDVSGVTVTRTWTIDKHDPGTLVTKIAVRNTTPTPITTSIVEPIPTTSLKRITFKPLDMPTTSIPGLGRFPVTVPNGGTVTFGYTARLTPQRKVTPEDRLATVKAEMEATLPVAQATDADIPIAATKDRYSGTLEVTEVTAEGLEGGPPPPPPPASIVLRLTPAPSCRVVSRGCRFTAQDSYLRDPKLATLEPAGNALVASGFADVPESGLTCDGTNEPGVFSKHWTFEPTAWRLTWAGWEVTQGRYTIVADLSAPESGRCYGASVHTVTTGLLAADPGPTIRG